MDHYRADTNARKCNFEKGYAAFLADRALAQRALAARLIASLPAADSLRLLPGFLPTFFTMDEPKAAAAAPNAVSCRSNLVICVLILRCSRRIDLSICMIFPRGDNLRNVRTKNNVGEFRVLTSIYSWLVLVSG